MGLRGPIPKPESQRRRRPDPDALPVRKAPRGSWTVDENDDMVYTPVTAWPVRYTLVDIYLDDDEES